MLQFCLQKLQMFPTKTWRTWSRVTSLHPVCSLSPACPCESHPPPALGAPNTASVNNNDCQTDNANNVASWNGFGKTVLPTGTQCKDIPRGTLWTDCVT